MHMHLWLSAHWLASCHQRPGCQGNHPPSTFSFASCCSPQSSASSLLVFSSSLGECSKTSACQCVCVCVNKCLLVCMTLWTHMCVLVTAYLCHAEWPLPPLVMDCEANLLQQLITSLSVLSWQVSERKNFTLPSLLIWLNLYFISSVLPLMFHLIFSLFCHPASCFSTHLLLFSRPGVMSSIFACLPALPNETL